MLDEKLCNLLLDKNSCNMMLYGNKRFFYFDVVLQLLCVKMCENGCNMLYVRNWAVYMGCMCENGLL
jgi:hypothetical protein